MPLSLSNGGQRETIRKPSNKNLAELQSVPPTTWHGEKQPLVLTLPDPERPFRKGNGLSLLHHFQMFTGHQSVSTPFDAVDKDTTMNLALEVRC